MNNATLSIVYGPDRFSLMVALFSAEHPRPTVKFTVTNYNETSGQSWDETVSIHAVSLEDGTGEKFCFKGFNSANHAHLEGYYDIKRRSGCIAFEQRTKK